jgi:DNA gyrase/topoisomerase IV subunit A
MAGASCFGVGAVPTGAVGDEGAEMSELELEIAELERELAARRELVAALKAELEAPWFGYGTLRTSPMAGQEE